MNWIEIVEPRKWLRCSSWYLNILNWIELNWIEIVESGRRRRCSSWYVNIVNWIELNWDSWVWKMTGISTWYLNILNWIELNWIGIFEPGRWMWCSSWYLNISVELTWIEIVEPGRWLGCLSWYLAKFLSIISDTSWLTMLNHFLNLDMFWYYWQIH